MIERGVTFREYEAHYKTIEVNCQRERDFVAPQLGLIDVFSAYIMLFTGVAISILICCIEKLFSMECIASKLRQLQL